MYQVGTNKGIRLGCFREFSIETLATRDSCRLGHEPHPESLLISAISNSSFIDSSVAHQRALRRVPLQDLMHSLIAVTFMAVFYAWCTPLTSTRSVRQYWYLQFWTAALNAMYSGLWRRVVWQILANVSQKHTASSFSLKYNSVIISIFFHPVAI